MNTSFFSRLSAAAKIAAGCAVIIVAGITGYILSASEHSHASDGVVRTGTFAGPAQQLGSGTAHAFVTLDKETPVALGVRVTEAALETLPADAGPHGVHETMLALPVEAPVLPYDHVSFDWQPRGHEPDGVYDRPHFDVHFYAMSSAERDLIVPTDEKLFNEMAARVPAPQYIPAGYVATPGAIPRMGAHWIDPASPEFTPAGFSRTFLYGFWDGRMNFLEPMITTDYLVSVKALPTQSATFSIPQPQAVEKAGYYPTTYSVRYDADAQAYDIVLEGLTKRNSN